MKKVIIIGASGSLAQYVIDALKQNKDVALTLFVRNKNRLMQCSASYYYICLKLPLFTANFWLFVSFQQLALPDNIDLCSMIHNR